MKKKLSIVIVAIAIITSGIMLLKPVKSEAANIIVTCQGTVSGLEYVCTSESNEDCTYVNGGNNGQTLCYGKFYQR